MADLKKQYNQLLETLIAIFTIDNSKIKILLMRKKNEPYKGYWILPGSMVGNTTLEDNISDVVYDKLGIPNLYIEQCYTFSNLDRIPENRVIATTFIGLINNITLKLRQEERTDVELSWFDIDSIPKTAYDHDIIIAKLLDSFKKKLVDRNILKILFPSDFTLPELQKVYEQAMDVKLDRRNFRKKLINMDYIVDTGDVNEGSAGRPAKLYRFKDENDEK